jgi:signal transduction histidine kinase
VGRLAGGLAHDFNNLLMVVMGNADLMLERCRLEEADRAAVEHIRAAGESGAALTRQLLAFGRQQELQTSIVDLDEVVSRAEPLLRGILPEGVELVARLAGDLGAIRADPGQLEQILINLVVNARDAMPDGGRLTLETANVDPSSETLAGRQPLREGRLVMLAVTDTGVGMDDGTKGRVFEPFFTTKEHTHGSGLGLASVYGIVEQSAGFIRLESEVGRGSRFEIYFPRISGSG